MSQTEVAFKIAQTKEEAEKILLDKEFKNLFKTKTRDIYFGKDIDFDGKTEEEIKRSLIRFRNLDKIENLKVFDKSLPDRLNVDKKLRKEHIKKLKKAGYKIIFDTYKTDWVYEKDNCCHQLQDIKNIGLLDYVYVKFNEENLTEEEMFEIVKKHILKLGFELEFDLGVDKLRSLYYKELKFSQNQIGLYEFQE